MICLPSFVRLNNLKLINKYEFMGGEKMELIEQL